MHWRRALSFLTSTGLAFVFLGCSKRIDRLLLPNENPVVRLGVPRVVASAENERTYAISWDATDADGQVRHVLVALDPPSLDPNAPHWTRTNANTHVVTVTDAKKDAVHRFVVRAVDDRGGVSEVAILALGAGNVPPVVRVTCPRAGAYPAFVLPSVQITWDGEDPDGVFTTKPVKYKFILLSPSSEFSKDLASQQPDSLRRYYLNHPNGPWAGWDSTSAETTQVQFTNLIPSTEYVFTVIGFDEAGAYSPLFDFTTNMITLRVGESTIGPRFTLSGETLEYTYTAGGYSTDLARHVRLEVPGQTPVPIRWYATGQPAACGDLRYRWVLDPVSIDDQTPRSDEATDVHHWSAWSPNTTTAVLGPFVPPSPPKRDVHTLYIEADDGLAAKSLAILDLIVVPSQAIKDLLIVDDTRLRADFQSGGVTLLPSGPWPTAAELDTFLFARGGVEWRSYPAGVTSVPGVFAGYSFDTLGTRGLGIGFVPLSTLSQYRHVIWYVDGPSAQSNKTYTDPVNPMTALRQMGLPGHTNALASYVRMGGKLWLAGGGAGAAVSDGFNDVSNDRPPVSQTKTFSSISSTRNELGPGRFMYDISKWQSEFRILKPIVNISRSTGRFTNTPTYAMLPDRLDAKSVATDPLSVEAPTRTSGSFYQTGADIEFLQQPNVVLEDFDPSPDAFDLQSSLDTLYRVRAATLPDPEPDPALSPRYVVMTHYRGASPGVSVLHSGFPFWWAQRRQCEDLIDFVLGDLWGLTKADTRVVRAAQRKR